MVKTWRSVGMLGLLPGTRVAVTRATSPMGLVTRKRWAGSVAMPHSSTSSVQLAVRSLSSTPSSSSFQTRRLPFAAWASSFQKGRTLPNTSASFRASCCSSSSCPLLYSSCSSACTEAGQPLSRLNSSGPLSCTSCCSPRYSTCS
ncbi:hypothetical protein V8C86DRAFT_2932098 [Haematococcus lacustris]